MFVNASSYTGMTKEDAIQTPVTHQGEVTFNVVASENEFLRRKNQTHEGTYPGGATDDNHHIKEFELVFGYKNNPSDHTYYANDKQVGFTSFNGMPGAKNPRKVTENIYPIGVVKGSGYTFQSEDQPKHGFSVIGVGHASTYATGKEHIYPGDLVEFSAPDPFDMMKGEKAVPGNSVGTPYGKQRAILKPCSPTDFGMDFALILSMLDANKDAGGINDLTEDVYLKGSDNKKTLELTEGQEMALLFREIFKEFGFNVDPGMKNLLKAGSGTLASSLGQGATEDDRKQAVKLERTMKWFARLVALMNNVKRRRIVGVATSHADLGTQLNIVLQKYH